MSPDPESPTSSRAQARGRAVLQLLAVPPLLLVGWHATELLSSWPERDQWGERGEEIVVMTLAFVVPASLILVLLGLVALSALRLASGRWPRVLPWQAFAWSCLGLGALLTLLPASAVKLLSSWAA